MDVAGELPELRFAAVVVVQVPARENAACYAAEAVGEEAKSDSGVLLVVASSVDGWGGIHWMVLNW